MKKAIRVQFKSVMRHDVPAGLTVFFVALPLSLGIAIASEAPVGSGIISGVVGGILVSLISRSALSVSGPAAGLSTIVAAGIATAGSFEAFLPAIAIGGLLQLLLGALRVGVFVSLIPTAVVKGMLAGIGILLIAKQIPIVFGVDAAEFWSGSDGLNLSAFWQRVNGSVLAIAALSLTLLVMLPRFAAKLARVLPVPLLAVAAATAAAVALQSYGKGSALSAKQLVHMPEDFMRSFVFPAWGLISQPAIWKTGVVIGLVASLETLLCVEAIDKIDPHRRITPANRELVAQGAGNLVCGLLGGIPMTAVIVRGAANIQAGARSRASAFFHGVFLLVSALFLAGLINQIPLAALSAILLVTGYHLCSIQKIRAMWRLGSTQFLPFVLTLALVAGVDLLVGVLAGILVSCYFILYRTFKTDYDAVTSRSGETQVIEVRLHRNVTFLNKMKLKNLLGAVPEYSIVRIDGTRTQFIDYDILELFAEYSISARDRHIQFELLGNFAKS